MSTDVRDSKSNDQPATRILTRRASRSTSKPESPPTKEAIQDDSSALSSSDMQVTPSPAADTDSTPTPESRKRPRRGGQNNKRSKSKTGSERETRNTTQRLSKEARDARKLQREEEVKQKMAELDEIEAQVKAGTHPEFLQLIKEIDAKQQLRIKVADGRRRYAESNREATYKAAHKAAYDNFQLEKQNLRRRMMRQIQQQISRLEQEYYSCHTSSSLDNQHVAEWIPRNRPARLDSVILSLSDQQIQQDLELIHQKPASHPSGPPPAMQPNGHRQGADTDTDTDADTPTVTATAAALPRQHHAPPAQPSSTSTLPLPRRNPESPSLGKLSSLVDHPYQSHYPGRSILAKEQPTASPTLQKAI